MKNKKSHKKFSDKIIAVVNAYNHHKIQLEKCLNNIQELVCSGHKFTKLNNEKTALDFAYDPILIKFILEHIKEELSYNQQKFINLVLKSRVLKTASYNAMHEIIDWCVKQGVPIHQYKSHNDSLLTTCIKEAAELEAQRNGKDKEYLDVIQLLIKNGIKIKESLHIASFYNMEDVMNFLIEHGSDPNEQNSVGETPLFYAINGAYQSRDLGMTHNYIPIVSMLIEKGAKVNLKTYQKKETPLHYAAEYNLHEIYNFLISKGAKKDIKNIYGKAPSLTLSIAQQNSTDSQIQSKQKDSNELIKTYPDCKFDFKKHNAILKNLIDKADLTAGNHEQTSNWIINTGIIHDAVFYGLEDIVHICLTKYKISPDLRCANSYTLLMLAIQGACYFRNFTDHSIDDKQHLFVIRKLLEFNANPNLQDINGDSALHHAARHETLDLYAQLLIGSGDPYSVNKSHLASKDILHYAGYTAKDILQAIKDMKELDTCLWMIEPLRNQNLINRLNQDCLQSDLSEMDNIENEEILTYWYSRWYELLPNKLIGNQKEEESAYSEFQQDCEI